MSKTFCPLPWMHLGTHPHGGVTPCCISDMTAGKNRARNFTDTGDQFFNLNDHSISKHMNRSMAILGSLGISISMICGA